MPSITASIRCSNLDSADELAEKMEELTGVRWVRDMKSGHNVVVIYVFPVEMKENVRQVVQQFPTKGYYLTFSDDKGG